MTIELLDEEFDDHPTSLYPEACDSLKRAYAEARRNNERYREQREYDEAFAAKIARELA